MDPMDYILHNPSRLPSHADPVVYSSPQSWMSHSHSQAYVAPPAHWTSHPSVVPQQFHHQPSHHPGPHAFQLGQNGGLPLPDPNMRGFPLPDPLAGLPMHPPRPWNHHFQPIPPPANAAAVPPNHMAMPGSANELPFGLIAPAGGRSLHFQPPGDLGLASPGATSGPNSMPRSLFSPSAEHSVNSLGQQIAASQFSVPPPHHFNSTPSRRGTGHHLSSTTHRAPRTAIPPPSFVPLPHHHETTALPSSTSDRRRAANSRARRVMNARVAMADSNRDSDGDGDDDAGHLHDHGAAGLGHRTGQAAGHLAPDDTTVRQMQVIRGALTSKLVVSRLALQSLQSVNVEDLPESERTCVICYNDYGVETPEGINEAPLRLPKCRHVFGDHCIKKWFEDSDSCPYCRDKLHSEPKHHISSARAFMSMMRMRGPITQEMMTDEVYTRLMTGLSAEAGVADIAPRQPHVAERRSLPDDTGENQRRTRPRRNPRDDGDFLTAEEHWAPPASVVTPSSSGRIPSQTLRYPLWMGRPSAQRRTTYAAFNVDADPTGHRRHGSHSHYPVGAAVTNMNVDMTLPNPLQAHRTDGLGVASSSVGVENMPPQTNQSAPEQQPALADQNRNRPW